MINKKLAIIIPAYKDDYLRKALASLSQQTNLDFNVYLGDDCSPYQLKSICDDFKNSIDIVYHRFEKNLGRKDLVSQWERCVDLIQNEEWIWIFSDDDVAESYCVESFYKTLIDTKEYYDVYRFNTCVINHEGNIIYTADESPTIENAMSLAYNILLNKRGNSMPDHIFKRKAYIKNNGVENFIQGQASDWATSIKFAYEKGLYTIAGPKVQWRLSGQNISALAHSMKSKLIFGHLQFIEWVIRKFNNQDEIRCNVKLEDIIKASKHNLREVINSHYRGIPFTIIFSISRRISVIYDEPFLRGLYFCLKINYNLIKNSLRKKLVVK